jgi:hypothetical protein
LTVGIFSTDRDFFYTESEINGMTWIRPEFSRDEINWAGKTIHKTAVAPEFFEKDWVEYDRALHIVNNWRGAHGYPLISLRMNLTNIAGRYDSDPLIAQRIKGKSIAKAPQNAAER